MKLYILDTNIAGFAMQANPSVLRHIVQLPDDAEVVTTVITVGEAIGGWLPLCRRATDGAARAQAYLRLQQAFDFYRAKVCLPFDDTAARIFDQLRAQKLRVGTNDLAIASITLAADGILVTRNAKDFERVPGLRWEDWTQ